eukprot:s741_g11.t1
MASLHAQQFEILVACTCNCFSSVGMLLFNKLAVQALPLECSLVWLQLFFAAFFMLIFGFPYLHIGSMKDFLRWCMVVPFFTGMLMTSILALKKAPMSLVIVLRSASPLFSLIFERFYPEPLRISGPMVCAIVVMVAGAVMYVSQLHAEHWEGIGWVMLNSIVAVCDRLLQRLLLSKEQHPVDISKTGITVINNMMGLIPVGMAAYFTGEVGQFPYAYANLTGLDKVYIGLSCVIGLSIGFTGIWAQSLISATSFLVMVNANKFVIIGIEAFGMHTKVLTHGQILGASLSILGGILYGKARQQIEQEEEERKQLLPSVKVPRHASPLEVAHAEPAFRFDGFPWNYDPLHGNMTGRWNEIGADIDPRLRMEEKGLEQLLIGFFVLLALIFAVLGQQRLQLTSSHSLTMADRSADACHAEGVGGAAMPWTGMRLEVLALEPSGDRIPDRGACISEGFGRICGALHLSPSRLKRSSLSMQPDSWAGHGRMCEPPGLWPGSRIDATHAPNQHEITKPQTGPEWQAAAKQGELQLLSDHLAAALSDHAAALQSQLQVLLAQQEELSQEAASSVDAGPIQTGTVLCSEGDCCATGTFENQ